MQFGVGLFPFTRFAGVPEMGEVAKLAEALGFDAVLLPEHLLPPRWPAADLSTKYWFDLPVLAAYLAAHTERIRFLTGVIVVPYHQPVALAKALATLDVVSNGRLSCGVGAGWMRAEFRRLGIPFEQRGAITDEYLRAIRELWTSDAPSFHGRYVAFEDVSFYPRPVQQPSIPLYIGGSGPRPLRRTAELGDGWLPMAATPQEIAAGVVSIRARMTALSRDSSHLWVGYTGLSLGADAELQAMRGHVGSGSAAAAVPSPPLRDRDEIVAAIRQYADAGVTFLSVGFAWRNARELMLALEGFARDVLPVVC